MKIHCLYDELLPVKELRRNPKNPNIHSKEQIERLAQILEYQGWRYAIKVSRQSGFITSGHGRLEAAIHLGQSNVPVVFQDYDDEEHEYSDIVADNAIASWAELNLANINTEIGSLGPDFDIDLLGIKDFTLDISDKLEPGCDEDEVPEKVEPKAKTGDIYQLGRHRLMCGDSTSIDAVEKLMDGKNAEICFTSPPYNAAATPGGLKHSRHRKYLNWESDAKTEDDYESFLVGFLGLALQYSKYQFINLQLLEGGKRSILKWLSRYSGFYLDHLIWDKTTAAPTPPQTITPKHEMIFIFSNEKNPNKKILTMQENHIFSVLKVERNSHNSFAATHKATFPVALSETVLNNFSSPGALIYEPFSGSGTTMIACEKINKACFGMELDPGYIDLAIARWEKYTGKKAQLTNG
jgi:DNA modification methylase